jgi:hypothetical protein
LPKKEELGADGEEQDDDPDAAAEDPANVAADAVEHSAVQDEDSDVDPLLLPSIMDQGLLLTHLISDDMLPINLFASVMCTLT